MEDTHWLPQWLKITCCPCCTLCCFGWRERAELRRTFELREGCSDLAIWLSCPCLALAQEMEELKDQHAYNSEEYAARARIKEVRQWERLYGDPWFDHEADHEELGSAPMMRVDMPADPWGVPGIQGDYEPEEPDPDGLCCFGAKKKRKKVQMLPCLVWWIDSDCLPLAGPSGYGSRGGA